MSDTAYLDFLDNVAKAEYFFRLGMEAAASRQLMIITDKVLTMLPLYSTVEISNLNLILNEIIINQEKKNWTRVADLLYYELAPQITRGIHQHYDSLYQGLSH